MVTAFMEFDPSTARQKKKVVLELFFKENVCRTSDLELASIERSLKGTVHAFENQFAHPSNMKYR